MTIEQAIEQERAQAAAYQIDADNSRGEGRPGAAASLETFAQYHTQLADWLAEFAELRTAKARKEEQG